MKHLKRYKQKGGLTFKEWLKHKNININTEMIECRDENLIDLNGIEEFISLRYLDCSKNNLLELPDLSSLKKLERLDCYSNKLTKLPDLSNLFKLEFLDCSDNKLTELPDLSNLENLQLLYCSYNNLPFESNYNNKLEAYLKWHKKEYPWIWDAKKYNL
jgi:Leucine-rich repeat (LRR) protein